MMTIIIPCSHTAILFFTQVSQAMRCLGKMPWLVRMENVGDASSVRHKGRSQISNRCVRERPLTAVYPRPAAAAAATVAASDEAARMAGVVRMGWHCQSAAEHKRLRRAVSVARTAVSCYRKLLCGLVCHLTRTKVCNEPWYWHRSRLAGKQVSRVASPV